MDFLVLPTYLAKLILDTIAMKIETHQIPKSVDAVKTGILKQNA